MHQLETVSYSFLLENDGTLWSSGHTSAKAAEVAGVAVVGAGVVRR